ncbi:SH3 domain-containing protein [Salinisphaera orenii]|uniref:SH3b domain-containing protein n=1 Tax=Salinisphaera orenii YIM 95161 TaxID=1051139 RepID=A0A423PV18_9GAMM|nr:SH3 domain-containing protein [Salinisphaera halophila]ROO29433.1 hypothetical protein SAHL_09070 [Salinisphaera halophila YIM 95161]
MTTTVTIRGFLLALALTGAASALAQEAPTDDEAQQIRERTAPLAAQGNASAQYNMGVLYDGGYGVERNYETAMEWYRRAAEQEYAKAEHNLGIMYQEGHGTEADPDRAAEWFRRAAEHGEPAAQNNLAVMYVRGQGVPRDLGQAAKWAARAAEAGNESARANLPHIADALPASRIEGDNVNIRSEPSRQARVLRQADGSDEVVLLARDGDWTQVLFRNDNAVGWVANFLLAEVAAPGGDAAQSTSEVSSDASQTPREDRATSAPASDRETSEPADDAAPEADEKRAGPQMHIGQDVVNVRRGPSTGADIAFKAERDENVTVLAEEADWRRVRFEDGRTGWVAGFLLAD